MSKVFTVEYEIPKGAKPGDIVTIEVELPTPQKKQRGQLAGIALVDMTDEQLKRELINANSVLYKAKQRGASEETIAANQARVDAANAEKAKRAGTKTAETASTEAGPVDGDVPADAGTAAEI
jgi:hypothetical protein